MVTHSSNLAWRIPMDGGAGQATVHVVAKNQTQMKRLGTHAKKMFNRRSYLEMTEEGLKARASPKLWLPLE